MNLLPFVATGIGLGAVYAMSGVGLVLLYRASGTLNFASGALGAVAAHCAWTLIQFDVPVALAWFGRHPGLDHPAPISMAVSSPPA